MHQILYLLAILGTLQFYSNARVLDCKPPNFLCKNTRCIDAIFECDGEDDCGDSSDEDHCGGYTLSLPINPCANDEYQCADRYCIPIEKFCDRTRDCPDASDEYDGCVKELKCPEFRCGSGYCVRKDWVCDGMADCDDETDEKNCENVQIPINECHTGNDRYSCKNKRCIPLIKTCNAKDDCGDGSDENAEGCIKANEQCAQAGSCNQICRRTPEGAVCACNPGYALSNNATCKDINECEFHGACDQECVNNAGSYSCSCQTGYNLQSDRRTCKADGGEALMIFSVKSEIRGFYLDSEMYYSVMRNLKHAVGVSLDANYVYWSDIDGHDETIFRSRDDGTDVEVFLTSGLGKAENIAVDWVTGNVYFTDSTFMHIGVCSHDGSYCTILLKARSGTPRGLALHPANGILYWSEYGYRPHISVAGMDGEDAKPFITTKLSWPNGLAIDYASERLYWVDAKSMVIESVRLDGTDRRVVLEKVAKHPFSLAVFENKLYWSDWSTNTIQSCNKFNGKDWKILLRENSTVYGLHIYHSVLKPKIYNSCNARPCTALCLLNRNSSYTCACPLDQELNTDQHTCRIIKKKEHLLVAAGNKIINYYHELLGKPNVTSTEVMKHITAMTYNSLTGTVFASDQMTDKIFLYNPNTKDVKGLISLNSQYLGGIDFDYIGNNLYLTDIEHKTIEVHSLTTNEKALLYFHEQPYDIVVIPDQGIMFVVFHQNDTYRIDRMQMNGIGSRTTIIRDLVGPRISLCYDDQLKRVFWADEGTGRIESMMANGGDRYQFRAGLNAPVSLAVSHEQIFWTQRGMDKLYWANKNNTNNEYQKETTLPDIPRNLDVMHLVTMHATYVPPDHGCRRNNGNCSHVCLVSNLDSHVCVCPPDMAVAADGRTCIAQTTCDPDEIKCSEHDICIKRHQLCDGKHDCPNGDDETNGCVDLHACRKDEFECKSGMCISQKKRCNSHYDCPDRSDEADCDKKECQNNEFQCREGACIPETHVCDGHNDCSDFSDELNCAAHTCKPTDFVCNDRSCIPHTWQCDGQSDCPDDSDEDDRCKSAACQLELFTCLNQRCIDPLLKCDGVNDCGDHSDEKECFEHQHAQAANCSKDQYRCYNTDICQPMSVRCNGVQDCPKNDDERGCAQCQPEEFACDNQRCINKDWVCDSKDDCGDKSDERGCSGDVKARGNVSISFNCEEFRCKNGVCLPFERVCDGIPDCVDQSDEEGQCATACTKNNPCPNVCHKTPMGPICGCHSGFRLTIDKQSCEDVNECNDNSNVCAHLCYNIVGSYICSCYEGYVLRNDRITCKAAGPQMELITIVKNSIRKLTPNLSKIEVIHEEANFGISGIDTNAVEQSVYWSNDELGMISKMHLETKERTYVTGVGRPDALAVDWATDHVYFNDGSSPASIRVCNMEKQRCATLVTIKGRSKPISIAVTPKEGWLFWSQTSWPVSDDEGEIYRTDLMGANMTIIAFQHVAVVSGFAIDHIRSRLYWSDSFLKSIEVSDFYGTHRETFMTVDYQPLSINLYEDSLFWLMGNSGNLKRCWIHKHKSCTTMVIGPSNIDRHFTIYHISRQPHVKNTCKNQTCEYMCIPRNSSATCICGNGLPVKQNDACSHKQSSLIKFVSSTVVHESSNVRQEGGPVIGTVITLLCVAAILGGYCYYQRIKPNVTKKQNHSIHFQNPSFDRRNEIMSSLRCIRGLSPGEHEYTNPIIDIGKNQNETSNMKNAERGLRDDQSGDESDESWKQNIKLIH